MGTLFKSLAITGLAVFTLFIAVVIWVEIAPGDSAVISDNRADFHSIGSALRSYRISAGHYPSTEQGLKVLVECPTTPPFPENWVQIMTKVPTDPWRNEYRYRSLPEGPPQAFELISNGPDGIEGTKDDRSFSDRQQQRTKP
jgi:general secretion pathway protein G